jgi:hypothetical protein
MGLPQKEVSASLALTTKATTEPPAGLATPPCQVARNQYLPRMAAINSPESTVEISKFVYSQVIVL